MSEEEGTCARSFPEPLDIQIFQDKVCFSLIFVSFFFFRFFLLFGFFLSFIRLDILTSSYNKQSRKPYLRVRFSFPAKQMIVEIGVCKDSLYLSSKTACGHSIEPPRQTKTKALWSYICINIFHVKPHVF